MTARTALSLVCTLMVLTLCWGADETALEKVKAGLAREVNAGHAPESAKTIAALDEVLKAEKNPTERAEALALRGFLHMRLGKYDQAIGDLRAAVRNEKTDPAASVPVLAASKWQLVKRPAAELLIEAYLHAAENEDDLAIGVLREARAYFQLAAKATRMVDGVEHAEALRLGLLHDEKIVDLFLQDEKPGKIIQGILREVFVVDSNTEVVRVRNSKFASLALLRLAELVKEDPNGNAIRLGHQHLTPGQLVLLAMSMPSATETSHRRGAALLAKQFDTAGATATAARLRKPESAPTTAKLRAAAQELFVKKDANAALNELDAASLDLERGRRAVQANLNPIRGGTVLVTDADTLFNVTATKHPGPPSFDDEVVEYATARALEAAVRWALAFDGPDKERANNGDRALRLAVEAEALTASADWKGKRPGPQTPAVTHLLQSLRAGLAAPATDARFDRLASAAHQFARSRLLAGTVASREEALLDYRLAAPDPKTGPPAAFDLWRIPSARLGIARAMIRHGQTEEAANSLHELVKVVSGAEAKILDAEFNRRHARVPAAEADEMAALKEWKAALEEAALTPSTVRAAVGSLRGLVSRNFRDALLTATTALWNKEECRPVLLDSLATDRLPEFDDFLAGLLKAWAAARFAPPKGIMPVIEDVEPLLAAVARSGGPKSLAELTTVYTQHCAPAAPNLSPLARYELFRQILEATVELHPEVAHSLAHDFFEKHRQFLDVPRPSGHLLRFNRAVFRDPDGAHRPSHPPTPVTLMTGHELLVWLAEQAGGHPAIPTAAVPAVGLPVELPKLPLEAKWWESVEPAKFLAAVSARKQVARADLQNGAAGAQAELLLLEAAGGTVALGELDGIAATKHFTELLAGLSAAKADGATVRVWLPFLPRPLMLKEAVALAELLNRQADPSKYDAHLATLLAADALRGTSYISGLRELKFFESANPPAAGDLSAAWRFAEAFARLGDSGLAPQLAGTRLMAGKSTDRTLEPRVRNLIDGVRAGVRIPLLATDKKTKQWVTPEEAQAFLLGQSGSPAGRLEAAYPAWVAQNDRVRQMFGSRNVKEFDTDGDGKADKFVTVTDTLRRSFPFLKAENDKVLQEIGRVRLGHRFPHAVVPAGEYPIDNDLGVAAFLRGDFAKAAEHFVTASQSDLGPGLLARRMAVGGRRVRVPAVEETWSLSAPAGPAVPPATQVRELAFALEGQRNLACLSFLEGRFDDALAIAHKVHDVERRGGPERHPDPALRPLALSAFYGADLVPLTSAARALHDAADAMYRRDVVRAEGLIVALPPQFRKSPLVAQLRLDIQLARLTRPGEVLSKEKQQQLLTDAERLVIELAARGAAADPAFAKHPGWLVVHAGIEDAMAQLAAPNSPVRVRQERSARDKRIEALALIAKGLAVLQPPAKGPAKSLPSWAGVYLEEAPRMLAIQAELAATAKQDEAKVEVPNVAAAYAALLQRAIQKDAPTDLAEAVLAPLAREASPAVEALLLTTLTPENVLASATTDRFGMSRLDWLLAAAVKAGQANGPSNTRELLIRLCEQLPLESSATTQVFDALYALDPARATRITLDRIAKAPAAQAEAVLANVSLNPARRQGVLGRPRVSASTDESSWYADAHAFWFYPPTEVQVTYGDRLATMIGHLAGNPQQFALVMAELEALTRRERLSEVEKLAPGEATSRLHSRIAAVLSEAQFPAALAILLRYCEAVDGGPLVAARSTAQAADYAPLVAAPWLADEPVKGAWKGQLGPRAWEHLRGALPRHTVVAAPVPDSSFLQAVIAAIEDDVRRGVRKPLPTLKVTNEAAVAGRLYNAIREEVLKNNNLSLPAGAAVEVNSFQAAFDAVVKSVADALRAAKDARKDTKQPDALARELVEHEVEAFTIRLWYVATRYADEGKSIGALGLPEVMAEYERLAAGRLADGAVKTVVADAPLTGTTNEQFYRPELRLLKRHLYLPNNGNQARYEEVFRAPDGSVVTLRGAVPLVYYGPLRKQPRLLDVLDLSLAKRATLLMNPLGPVHLSLDMSLRAPHAAWPALVQSAGAPDLNTYLAMCTRDLIPTTSYEFVQQVAPQTLQSTDVDGRMKAQEIAHERMFEAYFNQSYAGRALERAKGINDTIRTRLWGFITMGSRDNEGKKWFVGDANARAAQAAAFRREQADIDLLSLCDPSDPARFVLVTETGFSTDGKKWICRYRIGTVLGRSVYYEASGEVAKLSDVLQYLIAVNPGLVRKLPLDLGGLTADPEMQVAVALDATGHIAAGKNSVIAEMNREGLTPAGLKRALEIDLALFPGPNEDALKAKHKRCKELYARAFPKAEAEISLAADPHPALKEFLGAVQGWKNEIAAKGVSQADEVARQVIANSHDTNAWGIPGILCLYTNNGRVVQGEFMFGTTFGGPKEPPKGSGPTIPVAPRTPEFRPSYQTGPAQGNIDPRSGHEAPRTPSPVRPPGK